MHQESEYNLVLPSRPDEFIKDVLDSVPEREREMEESLPIYLAEIAEVPEISSDEEQNLFKKIQSGGREAESARRRLVKGNLRLIAWLARDYQGKGLLLLDLIQEGNVGLYKAIDEFAADGRMNFRNFVTPRIHKAISDALADELNSDRTNQQLETQMNTVHQIISELIESKGTYPSRSELAQAMSMTVAELSELLALAKSAGVDGADAMD